MNTHSLDHDRSADHPDLLRRFLGARMAAASVLPLLAVIVSLVATALLPSAAQASGGADGFTFGAVPAHQAGVTATSYFSTSAAPGSVEHEALVVSNYSTTAPIKLKVGSSIGVTAVNSGYAYVGAFAACRAASCWISGLPSTITVPAGKHISVPFTINVPAGASEKQYLTAISLEPARKSAPTKLGSGAVSAAAAIVHIVNVGVAITVGDITTLSRSLKITHVTATAANTTPRLLITERDTGQTFLTATGDAACEAGGHDYTFTATSFTILPGDSATLNVNGPGLPSGGTAECTVKLSYGGATAATWVGRVRLAATHVSKLVPIAPGHYSAIPKATVTVKVKNSVPAWALVAGAAVLALVLAMIVALALFLRRGPGGGAGFGPKRPRGNQSPAGGPAPVPAGARGAATVTMAVSQTAPTRPTVTSPAVTQPVVQPLPVGRRVAIRAAITQPIAEPTATIEWPPTVGAPTRKPGGGGKLRAGADMWRRKQAARPPVTRRDGESASAVVDNSRARRRSEVPAGTPLPWTSPRSPRR